MKINRKILMATLLIGAVSCASKNAVGVDQQQNVKYKEIDQQQQLANIRNEILECNFTDIDPNMFVMTIASAKIGSLRNTLAQNKIIDDKLISAFQKAIVDSPVIDKIALDSSKIDINTLKDQINAIHLSINYACIKDAVNVINSRESGELKVITDFVIALDLFQQSLDDLVDKDQIKDKDQDKKYETLSGSIKILSDAFAKETTKSRDNLRKNEIVMMLQNQCKESERLINRIIGLYDDDKIAVFGGNHKDALELFDSLNKGYDDIVNRVAHGNLENLNELMLQIKELTKSARNVLEMSESCKEDIIAKKDDKEVSVSGTLRRYAMLCRISSAMSFQIESLEQIKKKFNIALL